MVSRSRWYLQVRDPRCWLALVSTSSSYLLTVSLIGTLAAKLVQLEAIDGAEREVLPRLTVCAPDVAVLTGLAALLSAGEFLGVQRGLNLIKWSARSLAFLVFVFAGFNAAYMSVTGDQLTASIIVMGWHRLHDAYGILLEELRQHQLEIGAAVALLIGLPLAAARLLRRSTDTSPVLSPAWPLTVCSACAALVWALLPAPTSLPVARLARSATVASYLTWMQSSMSAMVGPEGAEGLHLQPLVESEQQNPTSRYNVVVIAIESLRADFTSLSSAARVQTPNIAALAQRAAFTDSASTPVPHTTKALFASHCGRMPFWQSSPQELNDLVHVQCLGQLLRDQGYATAFLQSAVGAFEDRPRLVHRLGYEHFEGWENIGGEPLGYLSSDDLSLATALDHFLDGLPRDRPFLTTLLTSATHHPYRLPQADLDGLQAEGVDPDSIKSEARYGKLAARADKLVGEVVSSLERRGLRDRTLIVVFGDHGEGFGEKGVRQHDNNYYQESLRVPLILAGPGVRPQRLADDVSLLDITPTLLDLLGFDVIQRDDPLYGRRALVHYAGKRTEYFACYYDGVCYGMVRGNRKLVVLPELKRALSFDLAADPDERRPAQVSDDAPEVAELAKLAPQLRIPGELPAYTKDLRFDNGWSCPASGFCRHPKTPKGLFFAPARPEQCVQVKPNDDHMLSLHNVCSGSMVCQVSLMADTSGRQVIKLKPDESRDLVLDRHADAENFKYKVDCQFL